ncbi:MAG: hypothetical protein PHQ86_06530 [Dehalococcoidales bacterium]|nr:hypothetical protein [Dehalococcoidales bacterium]
MSKSRVSPRFSLFQIVVLDYSNRKMPNNGFYVDKKGRGVREIVETIPEITKLKWAKNGKRAMAWARKFGSVISCRKVDSHFHKLAMIDYLRVEPKPMEVEFSVEEFTIGRDSEVKPHVRHEDAIDK